MEPIRVTLAKKEHITSLSPRIRDADKEEVRAFSGVDIGTALDVSMRYSREAYTVLMDEVPEAMFGVFVTNSLCSYGDKGSPWLMASDKFSSASKYIARHSKEWVDRFLQSYAVLDGWVDNRNVVSRRWLKWCGFTLHEPIIFGVEHKLFRKFEIRRDN